MKTVWKAYNADSPMRRSLNICGVDEYESMRFDSILSHPVVLASLSHADFDMLGMLAANTQHS